MMDDEINDPDSSFEVASIDESFSYSTTANPNPSYEVFPTSETSQLVRSSLKEREKYGSPDDGTLLNTRHVSGKKIDLKHAQYALSAGMMLGIRESVGGADGILFEEDESQQSADVLSSSNSTSITQPNTDKTSDSNSTTTETNCHEKKVKKEKMTPLELECAKVQKFKIPAGRHVVSSSRTLPYKYKFKAYSPLIFARIRGALGVSKQRFLHSICGKDSFIEFVSNAKSGQFFFYSHDGRYMIKTQSNEECKFLRKILPHYYKYMLENRHSFLTHFYGMYRVTMPEVNKSPVHFVIMKSVFNTEKEIHKIWDLKGSTKGRRAKRGDSVHKDLDIVDEGRKIYVGPEIKDAILEQLKKDAAFLAKMEIMDYSLLLGVHLRTNSDKMINSEHMQETLMRTNTPFRRMTDSVIVEGDTVVREGRDYMDTLSTTATEEDDSILSSEDEDVISSMVKGQRQNPDDVTNESHEKVEVEPTEEEHKPSDENDISMSTLSDVHCIQNPYTSRDDLGIESFSAHRPNKLSSEIYFCGIIDILQHYNARKWGETMMRKVAGNEESQISCVDPEKYADRFVDFLSKLLE